ncbi:MAG TPA: phenylalanine--tRNA ligase subunit beta [Spirochaetales bacterium]|nr:phenylalanine--tRNA ligase subunit beta [Spirochaetales bacterium]
MPKIEIYEEPFYRALGKKYGNEELIELLTAAKAELDEHLKDEGLLKIELNDTNRPDLWSMAGLARQLNIYLGEPITGYDFFSTKEELKDYSSRVVEVDAGLKSIRPYFAAFVARGRAIDEPQLKDLIQTQEKLCWNYGRRRSSISMGVYRADLIDFPIKYRAVDPDATSFVPLDMEKELSLRQILTEHPKGVEYGSIVADYSLFPFLEDSKGEVLSFPPIINSAHLGAVKVGDSEHLIEMTGTDMESLLHAASIVACDLADEGYEILPVKVIYPFDTPYGKEIVTPYYFQSDVTMDIDYAAKLLGEKLTVEDGVRFVLKMGSKVKVKGSALTVTPPPYRNDFLHPVDVVEEIMIGRGMDSFKPVWPEDFTVGRLSETEIYNRRIREIMVGLGYQEMIYNYLGSRRDFMERMNLNGEDIIEIANPMTENYEIVRNSQLPNLLSSESVSANGVYPHRIFEIGKIAYKDSSENYGSVTQNTLSFLIADGEAGFNDANSHLSALFFYLTREYSLQEVEDPRFINGRVGGIICNGVKLGIIGEFHPAVLDNWGIQMPCVGAEIDIDLLMGKE